MGVVCNQSICLEELIYCNHEKADTNLREFNTEDGSKTIMIRNSDTYVIVIVVSVLPIMQDIDVEKLCVAFG